MRLAAGIAFALIAPTFAAAQQPATFDLSVKSSIGQVLGYSAIEISTQMARFTDEQGHLSISLPADQYQIRIKHLGYKAIDTTFAVPSGTTRYSMTVTLDPIVVEVAATEVHGKTSCRILSDTDTQLGRVVGELRKNAERERLLRYSYPFHYKLAREYEIGDLFGVTKHRDTVEYPSRTNDPYVPGKLVRDAYKPVGSATRELRIPTLIDLADERFLGAHCFYYRGVSKVNGVRVHRIDFEPIPSLNTPDVRGTAYLDADSFIIRRAVFSLEKGQLLDPPVIAMEVTTTYREIFPGLALMDFIRGVQQIARGYGSRGQRIEEQRLIDVHFVDR